MPTIPLIEPRPDRLIFDGKSWTLGILRYERSAPELFAPRLSQVSGAEAIVERLQELGVEEALIRKAQDLLRLTQQGSAHQTWKLEEHTWTAEELPGAPAQKLEIHNLKEELEHLRAKVHQLEQLLASSSSAPPENQNESESPDDPPQVETA